MLDQLLTEADAAEALGIPATTLRQWRYLRRGPTFTKLGKHVRYPKRDLEAWIAEGRKVCDQ